MDLLLDRLKQEATKRVLFLHSSSFQYSKNMTVTNRGGPACEELEVFLKVRAGEHVSGPQKKKTADYIQDVL